eukprot:COSAG02_NODE_157_length_32999_cov_31.863647_21_plen_172_part_00
MPGFIAYTTHVCPYHRRALCPDFVGVTQGIRPLCPVSAIEDEWWHMAPLAAQVVEVAAAEVVATPGEWRYPFLRHNVRSGAQARGLGVLRVDAALRAALRMTHRLAGRVEAPNHAYRSTVRCRCLSRRILDPHTDCPNSSHAEAAFSQHSRNGRQRNDPYSLRLCRMGDRG